MEEPKITFEDVGTGARALILIHGAYSSRRVFEDQVAFFGSEYRVIVPDLRGHGDSEKPAGPYSIEDMAEDIARLARRLDLEARADVVGHSIGGAIAVQLAAENPDLIRAVATLDSPSIIPGWSKGHKSQYDSDITEGDFRRYLREYLDVAASPIPNERVRREELEEFSAVPDHVLLAIWGVTLRWKPETALTRLKQPLLYIDHGQPDLNFQRLRQLCPQLVTGQTVGAGHRALREVPEQVNPMLRRFLTNPESLAEYSRKHGGSFEYRSPNDARDTA